MGLFDLGSLFGKGFDFFNERDYVKTAMDSAVDHINKNIDARRGWKYYKMQSKLDYEYAQQMADYNANIAREQYDYEYDKESPAARREQLQAAGLNPALMYSSGAQGMQGSVGTTSGHMSRGSMPSTPSSLPGLAAMQMASITSRTAGANIDKMNAEAEKARAEASALRGETQPVKTDMAYKEAMTKLAESKNIGEGFKNEMLEYQRDIQEDVWNMTKAEQQSRINENNAKAKHFSQSAAYQALKVANFPDELANLRASTELMWQEAHIKEWQAYYAQEYYEALKDAARADADSKRLLYEYENATQEDRIQIVKNNFDMNEVQKAIIEATKEARIKLEEAMASAADKQQFWVHFKEYQALHESVARSIYSLARSYAIYKTGGRSEFVPDNKFEFEFGSPTDFD